MSKTYRCRPSELLHVTDALAAFYLDRAVMVFGQAVDGAVEEAITPKRGNKGLTRQQQLHKTMMVLQRWLRIPKEEKKYRDPRAVQQKW